MHRTDLVEPFRITSGKRFELARHHPAETHGLELDKARARLLLQEGIEHLAALQERLYAQAAHAVLLIFQAMDAGGKDSAIKHVMSGINPQGCQVYSFKQPSEEERRHDFMWRCLKVLPERGRIGIFNRSYYEDVLVVRVRPALLGQRIGSSETITKRIWDERLEDIAAVERYLARQGTVILKFFLNISKEEQRKRLLKRLDRPDKQWKFASSDVTERDRWPDYMAAYEHAIRATAAPHAPWFVVPADHKWLARLIIINAVVHEIERLKPTFPQVAEDEKVRFVEMRRLLGDGVRSAPAPARQDQGS